MPPITRLQTLRALRANDPGPSFEDFRRHRVMRYWSHMVEGAWHNFTRLYEMRARLQTLRALAGTIRDQQRDHWLATRPDEQLPWAYLSAEAIDPPVGEVTAIAEEDEWDEDGW